MFKKILVANRGEIALRVIRACSEMGIKSVAVYSTADKNSLHVKFADEAVCIGPAPSPQSYLDIQRIIAAAEITNSDAIHPGYGFLAENDKFSKICEENNIKFIGADAEMILGMGDKATAKATMKAAGVPTIPGSDGLLDSVQQGLEVAEVVGYPVILKATAGGGGRGMRIVNEPSEFQKAWDSARQEAGAAFGNDGMYLEKFVVEPRHVEIQVLGDAHGNAFHLSERDCSIQRRHQKLVEETPSPALTPEIREKMGAAAIAGAKAINYEGAGTVEFLLDKYGDFYFMEMNTRIQVEHPVTEEATDVDLIKEQIKAAAGVELTVGNQEPQMCVMECRINAEDPANDFRPSPGKIESLHFPGGLGVRVDSHVYAGYVIPPNYDSMIAKLIVKAPTREEVVTRMKRALKEFVIEGIKTTIPFHLKLMDNEQFKSGDFTTKFLDENSYETL
ncbi:acetyl-CoA carboxylase biotin carboxylase subunit [Sediminitomix flava]|uniref:Biotin carboxylase n=1 Tax=Sediminitomix flava TaxID=379075 RepID=A0A315Z554_SEDFL|nr:acetyl-CoA carboxylase biotin carboxylase subunit [Sediminitomix flava]PWJ38603.1 acetyl-CoA carboxylase biotin carboxylase subunit [Sediminitomix flava]